MPMHYSVSLVSQSLFPGLSKAIFVHLFTTHKYTKPPTHTAQLPQATNRLFLCTIEKMDTPVDLTQHGVWVGGLPCINTKLMSM